ncbi:MAG: MopE-related protein [Myxococcota bacterium]
MRTLPLAGLALLTACSNDIGLNEKGNVEPAAVINAPAAGSAFDSTQVVPLQGTVTDGNGLADIRTVTWSSNLDGVLGTPESTAPDGDGTTRASVTLSVGNHVVSLVVVDAAGESGEDSIDVVVGDVVQEPSATIDAPGNFDQFLPGDPVVLQGRVDDRQQAPDTLLVTWQIVDNTTDVLEDGIESVPDAAGRVSDDWIATRPGAFKIVLEVTDDDGNVGTAETLVLLGDPSGIDADLDGVTLGQGDCDDNDPDVYPGHDEVCGDLKDNDCNSVVDDKDLDNDGHIDEACVNYGGPDPADDCDDSSSLVFPGAPETVDGVDNDCDGWIDDETSTFDDDGDCFCEAGVCTGSITVSCGVLQPGDCDDGEALVNPDAPDLPDVAYVDQNCDGLDGDEAESIFLDPVNGFDTASGTTRNTPLRTLAAAMTASVTQNRDWVLIANGTLDFTSGAGLFLEGVNLAGGYSATSAWSRSAANVPTIDVANTGKRLTGWTAPTEWQQVKIQAASTTAIGGSSIALLLDGAVGPTLVDCQIIAGNAGNGSAGSTGGTGGAGIDGTNGVDGCNNGNGGICVVVGTCSLPSGGLGGNACGAVNNGGRGGSPGLGGAAGNPGNGGVGPGGNGGPAGGSNGGAGSPGIRGDAGAPGNNGVGGASIGSFLPTGYFPAGGTNGTTGSVGGGGGGGGGRWRRLGRAAVRHLRRARRRRRRRGLRRRRRHPRQRRRRLVPAGAPQRRHHRRVRRRAARRQRRQRRGRGQRRQRRARRRRRHRRRGRDLHLAAVRQGRRRRRRRERRRGRPRRRRGRRSLGGRGVPREQHRVDERREHRARGRRGRRRVARFARDDGPGGRHRRLLTQVLP